ncbi:MAG: S1C family serine protease [Burkholderiaceae bacterium]
MFPGHVDAAHAPRLAGWCTALALFGLIAATAPVWAADPSSDAGATPAPTATPDPGVAATRAALERARATVVGVQVTAVESARSARTLGTERRGSGVLIDADGLVLTIGYLILEADRVDLVLADRRVVPARVVAYDLASGFGLVQALTPVKLAPARLGDSAAVSRNEPLLIASGGRQGDVSLARMVSRRPYSGYWEYHIDGALFTAPVRTDHSGAALFNADGELLGIGSLVLADAMGSGQGRLPGNMFVPVDLLKPILGELRTRGTSKGSERAWLGVNCVEHEGSVRVLRVTPDSPGENAGLQPGDRILSIDGTDVADLESFYKALWRNEVAERDVRLQIRRGSVDQTIEVHTQDRMKTLSKPQGI